MSEPVAGFGQLLWGTLVLRPYVFLFLATYLWMATWHLGWARTLLYVLLGYALAWSSEFSSIHTGFPYGLYIYIPATRNQELWVLGVPFMDSLSYVFLAYASYSLALLLLAAWRLHHPKNPARPRERSAPVLIILAASLMVLLDIIIDPVALRGYRWFLGQIYGYPEPGGHFGVPWSNYAGWFLVGLLLMAVLHRLAVWQPRAPWLCRGQKPFSEAAYAASLLYLGVLWFNLIVTFAIGEIWLGCLGLLISAPVMVAAGLAWRTILAARAASGQRLPLARYFSGAGQGGQKS